MTTLINFLRTPSYEVSVLQAALTTLLEPWGGMGAFVKPGDRVLLKPNLLTGARPTKECTTRPELVGEVARMVQGVGGHPFLGDSPAFGTAQGVAIANGYQPWLDALQIPVVEFRGQRYPTSSQDFRHLRLGKEAMEADVVINLPKVKSHVQLTLTLGVKNLFGCVPGKMKAWWHMEAGKDRERFGQMLVETARTIQPDLTLVDGIMGHEGAGPSGGEPRFLGWLGASTDVFALDDAMLKILKADPTAVPTQVAAQRQGLVPEAEQVHFPFLSPLDLQIDDWQFPPTLMPIDFGAPRVLRSTLKHCYIRWIREPLRAYSRT